MKYDKFVDLLLEAEPVVAPPVAPTPAPTPNPAPTPAPAPEQDFRLTPAQRAICQSMFLALPESNAKNYLTTKLPELTFSQLVKSLVDIAKASGTQEVNRSDISIAQ